MEKRASLYISRRSPALWLAAACLLASGVLRMVLFSHLSLWHWLCPAVATGLYLLIALTASERMLYKTAIPVWLLGLCGAVQLLSVLDGYPLLCAAACLSIAFFCLCYSWIISGRASRYWLLALYGSALGLLIWARLGLGSPFNLPWYLLSEQLLLVGGIVLFFGIRVRRDGQYHPTWGDRVDGRRIRSIPAMDQLAPYIMVNRTGANNLFSESVEISQLERYVRQKRREGITGFGMTHVIIAAYVRTVAKYPALNRFIAGQKLYSRGNDISLSMTVKKELSASSPDTVIKAHFDPRDTALQVYEKFNAKIAEAKNTPLDSDVDNTAGIMTVIPGVLLKLVVWLLKTMDYFGLIPGFLLEISPFHGSAYFTSMGSLGIRPVYHHLYDFGTIPLFCAFGRKRRATELVGGEMVERKYVDLKFNMDERICDGYYYAAVIKHFVRLLSDPWQLDQPPETVVQDIP